MRVEELQSIMVSRGYEVRIQKDEVKVHICNFCANDRYNLELNPSMGIYHCWACKSGGTLQAYLSQFLHMTVHIPVNYSAAENVNAKILPHFDHIESVPAHEVPSAMHYLAQRGLGEIEVRKYHLRVATAKDDTDLFGRILFPVREYFAQTMWGFNGRHYTGKLPKYFVTFHGGVIHGYRRLQSKVVVLVEGLLDGIAVHRANANAAVMFGGAGTHLDEFAARLAEDDPLIIMLDGDAADKAKQIYHQIVPIHPRTYVYHLPTQLDPASLEPEVLRDVIGTVLSGQLNVWDSN